MASLSFCSETRKHRLTVIFCFLVLFLEKIIFPGWKKTSMCSVRVVSGFTIRFVGFVRWDHLYGAAIITVAVVFSKCVSLVFTVFYLFSNSMHYTNPSGMNNTFKSCLWSIGCSKYVIAINCSSRLENGIKALNTGELRDSKIMLNNWFIFVTHLTYWVPDVVWNI